MTTPSTLWCLAVLRAVVEGKDHGHYFGSTMALASHRAATEAAGWIDDEWHPTEIGRNVYRTYRLDEQPDSRATAWDLEEKEPDG
jgi:hypothetical protein